MNVLTTNDSAISDPLDTTRVEVLPVTVRPPVTSRAEFSITCSWDDESVTRSMDEPSNNRIVDPVSVRSGH